MQASAWLLKPTQVSPLRSKFCFGGQTKSLVQTSIFNLEKYLWQLQYYFKPFLFSRLQVESKIEKNTKPTPSPAPLTARSVQQRRTYLSVNLPSLAENFSKAPFSLLSDFCGSQQEKCLNLALILQICLAPLRFLLAAVTFLWTCSRCTQGEVFGKMAHGPQAHGHPTMALPPQPPLPTEHDGWGRTATGAEQKHIHVWILLICYLFTRWGGVCF